MDKASEAARGDGKIGTTARGIGPAYEDKMTRQGLRICDLMDADVFRARLASVVAQKNAISRAAYGVELETSGLIEESLTQAESLRTFVMDV
jgi:adenylosuccinate synthase